MENNGTRCGPSAYGEIADPPIFGNPIVYLRSSLDTNQCQLFPKIVGGSLNPSLIRLNYRLFATLSPIPGPKNERSTVRLEGDESLGASNEEGEGEDQGTFHE